MLYQIADIDAQLVRLGLTTPDDYLFGIFARGDESIVLGDDNLKPTLLVVHRGTNFKFSRASAESLQGAAADLYDGRVVQDQGWPDPRLAEDWKNAEEDNIRSGMGPGIFCNTTSVESWQACIDAGFIPHPETNDHQATLHYWSGQPRLRHELRHSCRLGRGMELFEQLRQGIGYDPEGNYIRSVLERRPSFLCEVNGEPVSWSTVHLNGSMGMIFTPEQHRRRGYARSLSAFQIDHVLREKGFACCHVVDGNAASSAMLDGLGSQLGGTKVVWRSVHWPLEAS